MRRAKIVATLGPATSSYENIRAIIDAGVDVCRMNLSHGTYDVHEAIYKTVRQAAEDSGRAVAVLVDLQGPKIRLGKVSDENGTGGIIDSSDWGRLVSHRTIWGHPVYVRIP